MTNFVIFVAFLAVCAVPVLLAVLIVRSKWYRHALNAAKPYADAMTGWIEKVAGNIAVFVAKIVGVLFVLACMLAALVFFIWLIKTIWYAV